MVLAWSRFLRYGDDTWSREKRDDIPRHAVPSEERGGWIIKVKRGS